MNCAFNDFYILIYQVEYNIILLIKKIIYMSKKCDCSFKNFKKVEPSKVFMKLEVFQG